MKKFTVIVAAVCVIVLVGCPVKKADDTLTGTDFSKAVTLGPVYKKYMQANVDKDWGTAWDCMSAAMHKDAEKLLEHHKGLKESPGYNTIKDMTARQYYIHMMKNVRSDNESAATQTDYTKHKYEILGEEIHGDDATITQKVDGEEGKIKFVKEDGVWKFNGK